MGRELHPGPWPAERRPPQATDWFKPHNCNHNQQPEKTQMKKAIIVLALLCLPGCGAEMAPNGDIYFPGVQTTYVYCRAAPVSFA